MPEFSIIIRTRNEEKWIGQCLRAIHEQTIDDLEVILVDNLSTDKTVEKAEQVCPDLTLVNIEDYLPGMALNEGIRASTGEYLVCLSAHCIPVHEEWLANLYQNFEEYDGVAGVYGRQVPTSASDPVDKRDLVRTFGPEHRVQQEDSFFHNANSMIRRNVWEEIPFKEEVTNIEDQIWGNEVVDAGYKLVYDPAAEVYHHHGINQGNDVDRTLSVVQTMENHEVRPDEQIADSLASGPLDPAALDIVSFIPIRQQADFGVDFDEHLIKETTDLAVNSEFVDDVILLTDSEYIVEKADEWGARAPFLRPPELSERDVEVVEVHQFGIEELEKTGRFPDLVITTEITHPFRPDDLLDQMVVKLLRENYDSVIATFPEYRPCWYEKDGQLDRINEDTTFRMDRRPVQIGLPSLGCVTHPKYLRDGQRFGGDIGVYEIDDPKSLIEIRNRDDLAEWERLRDFA